MSPQEQDRLAQFAQMEHSRPREIPPVLPVILRVRPATKLQPLASPATSTTSPLVQVQPVQHVL